MSNFAWFFTITVASIINFKEIYTAWHQCQKRKGKSPQAQHYAVNLLDNLFQTMTELQQKQWQPAVPICFVVHYPKAREVYAAQFSDRVVHHWLVPQLEDCYKNYFIEDVHSNIKGRGTHSAVKRLKKMMRSIIDSNSQAYFLQLDVANFFNSIDKPLLFQLLQRRLKQQLKKGCINPEKANDLRLVCHRLLKQNAGNIAKHYGNAKEWQHIPAHKRLKNAGDNKGLPIGNLSSQFFANVYLNELDQFVKHRLKCRHYVRYVDDFILLHHDPEQLTQWHHAIADFIQQKLQLSLRQETLLYPVQKGANFLGYIVRPHYCLVRRRVIGQLIQKLNQFQDRMIKGNRHTGWVLNLSVEDREQLQAVLASYLGHFKHAKHYHLLQRLWQRFLWLALLFNQQQCTLIQLWKPLSVTSFSSQQAYFKHLYPHAVLVIQKGYQSIIIQPTECLKGFNPSMAEPSLSIRTQVNRVIVKQQGYLSGGLRERCVSQLFINPGVLLCKP